MVAPSVSFDAVAEAYRSKSTAPGPFNPESAGYPIKHDDLRAVDGHGTLNERLSQLRSLGASTGSKTTMSYYDGQDTAGQGGYFWPGTGGGTNGNFWVAQDIVPPLGQGNPVDLPAPGPCIQNGTGCGNFLYAPTTHNGQSCWEVTSRYDDLSTNPQVGSTYYWFGMYDFCQSTDNDPTFMWLVPIDENFVNSYVTTFSNADHRPQYIVEVYYVNGSWHVYLWNKVDHTYHDVTPWTAYGVPPTKGLDGWSIYETHYNANVQTPYQQDCPAEPNLGASGIRVQTSSTNWNFVSYARLGSPVNPGLPNQCFFVNTPGNMYQVTNEPTDPNDYAWVGYSTSNMRNPDYGGGSSGGVPIGGGGTGGGGCKTKCPLDVKKKP